MKHAFDPTLYAIVDVTPGTSPRAEEIRSALDGGVTLVQVRGKTLTPHALFLAVRRVLPVCRAAGVKLIVNDRPDVAAAAGADGVHLGQDDVPAAAMRRWHPEWIVGVSVHDRDELSRAESAGADYVASGSLFTTGSKADAVPLDHDRFREICAAARVPVVGIGGIDAGNCAAVRGMGAAGVAVIRGLWGASDVRRRAGEFVAALGPARP